MRALLIAALLVPPTGTMDDEEARLWETVRAGPGPQQDTAGIALLESLEARGRRASPEARELLEILLADGEGPAAFWDARAYLFRSNGQWEQEANDLRALIAGSPGSDLADRARRRLPGALRKAGRLDEALAAEEDLIESVAVPPEAALARKADTLFRLQRIPECREVLEQLDRRYPGRLELDRHLAWIRASIIDRTGTREEAARVMLRFANRFPAAPERAEALYRTAEADRARGAVAGARFLYRQVIEIDPLGEQGLAARLDLAALGEDVLDAGQGPRTLYRDVLIHSADPAQVETAASRLVALDVEERGPLAALAGLGEIVEKENRLAALVAGEHAARLLTTLLEDAVERGDDAELLPLYELGLRAGVVDEVPEHLIAAVATTFRRVGLPRACLELGEYLPWDSEEIHRQAAICRSELGLSSTKEASPEILARQGRWRDLSRWAGDPPPGDRAIFAARAAFHQGDAARVNALLSVMEDLEPAALELLGDARSILGDRAAALEAYRRAAEGGSSPWIELRVLALEQSLGEPTAPEAWSALRGSSDNIVAREAERRGPGGRP